MGCLKIEKDPPRDNDTASRRYRLMGLIIRPIEVFQNRELSDIAPQDFLDLLYTLRSAIT